ncbi:hypothetical protein B0A48_13914 [Cryoendolithus antarcticus]|uniref:Major facilitator superfamily (MFS) profile domain-containing protein n=1 Tax=Cryoendolithus antarcticus TaxID=1507870 RepID=A0A1V8SLT5_9PEZI|nr:hypothetical protein B0A48_13914 [Cryoendolithus antarcticus]
MSHPSVASTSSSDHRPTFNGVRLFRYFLLGESAINISTAIPIMLAPEFALSFLVRSPSDITPAAVVLTQWFGAITLGLTVPLLLSVPHVPRAAAGRRMAYTTLGACEATLGAVMAMQIVNGESGFSDRALAVGVMAMSAFLGMRAFFLFVKPGPGWMEGIENVKKVQ